MRTIIYLITAMFILSLIGLGCSNSRNIMSPDIISDTTGGDYEIWQSGIITLDRETGEASIVADRENDFYFNITNYIKPYLKIRILSIVGTVWEIECELTNPTSIQVWDVRAVFLNTYGKKVLNPDGYTNLFDPSDINPYLAFAKEYPNRAFPVGPGAKDSEILLLDWPAGAGPWVAYKIGVSVGGNCGEPYMIANPLQSGDLYPSGGAANISVDVYDHQGDISAVAVVTTPLTGGITYLSAVDGTKYAANITNSQHAPIGVYTCLIAAESPNPNNLRAYNFMDITVIEEPIPPPVVTYNEAVSVGAIGNYTDNGKVMVIAGTINFTTGPWDFSSAYYDTLLRHEVISPNAGEFSSFKSKYPSATHVLRMPDLDEASIKYYPHYYSNPYRYDLGFEDSVQGVDKGFRYTNPVQVPFPIDINYSYNAEATGWTKIILPARFTITWDVDCIAWGDVKTHTITEKALLIRTIKYIKIGSVLEQYEAIYEWVGDSGRIMASFKTSDFDEDTGLPNPNGILEGYIIESHHP